ncbi:hypothetical protein [Clostridium sp.]|uniref:hypothetical protein n=1 Tax=Clostridium sp. TaxID=1506 RepID=UPI003D6CAE88
MDKQLDNEMEAYYRALNYYHWKFGEKFPGMNYCLPIGEAIRFISKCICLDKTAQEMMHLEMM